MTVLITGAGGGLGRAMAVECAARGYDVFLTDIDEEQLGQIASGLRRRFNVAVFARACDLTEAAEVSALFADIEGRGIRLGMLLGIAGVDFEGGFMDRDCERILDIVRLNIAATLRVTHAALSRRDKAKKFDVMIVSSLASLYPIPLKATYAASKRFLLDFSIALREEMKGQNVNVMALCPGGLPTTREAMDGIAAQGVWGGLTTNGLETVASKAVDRMMAGRAKYTPGFVNIILGALGKLVPPEMIAKMLHARWNDAQAQWLQIEA